jgi:hypothetical protein
MYEGMIVKIDVIKKKREDFLVKITDEFNNRKPDEHQITDEDAFKETRELWKYMAFHPVVSEAEIPDEEYVKIRWPGWKKYGYIENLCFICEISDCDYCLMKALWDRNCCEEESIYHKWGNAVKTNDIAGQFICALVIAMVADIELKNLKLKKRKIIDVFKLTNKAISIAKYRKELYKDYRHYLRDANDTST